MTQPGQPGGAVAQRPATAPDAAPTGGLFGRPGFMGGLFAGFLGAGLLGMMFGHGLTGGLGGFASMLGLMLQIGIVVIIGYLLWTWWQRRSQPALASGPSLRDNDVRQSGSGCAGFGIRRRQRRAASTARASGTDEVGLTPEDFNAFEKLLGEVQTAYGAEDLGRAALARHPRDGVLLLGGIGRQRQQRRGQQDLRREAAAGRSRRGLARRRHRLCHRRDALLAGRPDGRARQRPRACRAVPTKPPKSGPSCGCAAATGCCRRSSRPKACASAQAFNDNGRAPSRPFLFLPDASAELSGANGNGPASAALALHGRSSCFRRSHRAAAHRAMPPRDRMPPGRRSKRRARSSGATAG